MTDKERALQSKSFCSALWTSIFQNPDGMVAPCCVWDSDTNQHGLGNVNKSTLSEIFKSPTVLKLKEKMLSGETLNECNFCNKLETDIPGTDGSRRFFNDNFFESIDWDSSDTKFLYWDLRISNLCNFKCRMCYHDLSSAWYDDAIELSNKLPHLRTPTKKIIKLNDKSKFWNELETHYEHVQSIYFAGGEPFMNEHHFKILQDLIDRGLNKSIKLIVNTNLSTIVFKKKSILDYYKHFNYIVFGFSIDGSYKIGEYIRSGLDYKKWKENVKQFVEFVSSRNTLDITYLFQFAYGVTNLDNICDFILDLHNDGLLLDELAKFNFQPIIHPTEQSVQAVPSEISHKFKIDSMNLLIKLSELGYTEHFIKPLSNEFMGMYSYIDNNTFNIKYLDTFYKHQIELDKIRDEDVFKILPDYRKLTKVTDESKLI
tara:strand:- start:514 stop:1800 length:1287 start_codon:yes stop_codon:yes gene_type:complete